MTYWITLPVTVATTLPYGRGSDWAPGRRVRLDAARMSACATTAGTSDYFTASYAYGRGSDPGPSVNAVLVQLGSELAVFRGL
jgi:hypothetical protein